MIPELNKPFAEQELIERLRNRDGMALALLYDRYSSALFNIVSRLVPDEEVAKEVLQDAFVKIWNFADKYDVQKGRLFTWMVQITRNTAIDTLRSGQFKQGDKTESLPTYVSNDERLSEEQTISDTGLQKVISQLEASNRQLIELLYFQDYTQKEVSEMLNIPLGTVKSRVRKAISQLREILQTEGLIIGFIFIMLTIVYYFGR